MSVSIDFQSNSSQAQKDLATLNKSVQNIEKQANSAAKAMKNIGVSIIAAFTTAGGFAIFSKVNDEFTEMKNRIRLVDDNAKRLVGTQKELIRIAQETRASFKGTTEVYGRMGLAMKDSNKSAQQLLRATELIQKAAAISGSAVQTTEAALIQLGQGFASGQLRGQELMSVMEGVPRLATAIADGLKIPFGSLKKEAEAGNITAEAVFKAIIDQSAALEKEFGSMVPTISQGMLVIRQSLKVAYSDISEAVNGSSSFGSMLVDMSKSVDTFSANFADSLPERMASFRRNLNLAMLVIRPLSASIVEMVKIVGTLVPRITIIDSIFLKLKATLGENMFAMLALKLRISDTIKTFTELHWVSQAFNLNPIRNALVDIFNINYTTPRQFIYDISKGLNQLTDALRSVRTGEHWLTGIKDSIFQFNSDLYFALATLGIFQDSLIKLWIRPVKFNIMLDAFDAVKAKAMRVLSIIAAGIAATSGYMTVLFLKVSYPIRKLTGDITWLETKFRFLDKVLYDFDGLISIGKVAVTFETVAKLATRMIEYIVGLFRTTEAAPFFDNFVNGFTKKVSGIGEAMAGATGSVFRALANTSILSSPLIEAADKGLRIVRKMFDDIADSNPLRKVDKYMHNFSKNVIRYFFNIWDEVVGHSWWPDTIDGVVAYTYNLVPGVAGVFSKFKDMVKSAFTPDTSAFSGLSRVFENTFSNITKTMGRVNISNSFNAYVSQMEKLAVNVRDKVSAISGEAETRILAATGFAIIAWATKLAAAIPLIMTLLFVPSLGSQVFDKVNEFLEGVFGLNLVRSVGSFTGNAIGILMAEIVRGLPNAFNRIFRFIGEVFRGFFENLPLVEWIAKPLFAVAEALSIDTLLGVIGGALTLKQIAPFLSQDNVVRKFSDGLWKGVAGISAIVTGVKGANNELSKVDKQSKKDKNGLLVSSLVGVGGKIGIARLAGIAGILATISGATEALLGDSTLAKYITGTGFLGLIIGGEDGLQSVANTAISAVNDIFRGIRDGIARARDVEAFNVAANLVGPVQKTTAIESISNFFKKVMERANELSAEFVKEIGQTPIGEAFEFLFDKLEGDRSLYGTVAAAVESIYNGASKMLKSVEVSSLFANFKKYAVSSFEYVKNIGGPNGIIGQYLFGKAGFAALILLVGSLFSSFSNAAGLASDSASSFWEVLANPVTIATFAASLAAAFIPIRNIIQVMRKNRGNAASEDSDGTGSLFAAVAAGEVLGHALDKVSDIFSTAKFKGKVSGMFSGLMDRIANSFLGKTGALVKRAVAWMVVKLVAFVASGWAAITGIVFGAVGALGLLTIGLFGEGDSFSERLKNAWAEVSWFWNKTVDEANLAQKRLAKVFGDDDRSFDGARYGLKTNFDEELGRVNLENLTEKEVARIDKGLKKYQELFQEFREASEDGVIDPKAVENLKVLERDVVKILDRLADRSTYTIQSLQENLDTMFEKQDFTWFERLTLAAYYADGAIKSMGEALTYAAGVGFVLPELIDKQRDNRRRRNESYDARRRNIARVDTGVGLNTEEVENVLNQGFKINAFEGIENPALEKAFNTAVNDYQATARKYVTGLADGLAESDINPVLEALKSHESSLLTVATQLIRERKTRNAIVQRNDENIQPITNLISDLEKFKVNIDFDAQDAFKASDADLKNLQGTLEQIKTLAETRALTDDDNVRKENESRIAALTEDFKYSYKRFVEDGGKNLRDVVNTTLSDAGVSVPRDAFDNLGWDFLTELDYETSRLQKALNNYHNNVFEIPLGYEFSGEERDRITKDAESYKKFIDAERNALRKKVLDNTSNYAGKVNIFDLAGISLDDTLSNIDPSAFSAVFDLVKQIAQEQAKTFDNVAERQESLLKVEGLRDQYDAILASYVNLSKLSSGLSSQGFSVDSNILAGLDSDELKNINDLLYEIDFATKKLGRSTTSLTEQKSLTEDITAYKDELDAAIDKVKTLTQKLEDINTTFKFNIEARSFDRFSKAAQDELFALSNRVDDAFARARRGAIELSEALAIERQLGDKANRIVASNLDFGGQLDMISEAFGLTSEEVSRLTRGQAQALTLQALALKDSDREIRESTNGLDRYKRSAEDVAEATTRLATDAKKAAFNIAGALELALKDTGVNASEDDLRRLDTATAATFISQADALRDARRRIKNSGLEGAARDQAYFMVDHATMAMQEALDQKTESFFESEMYEAGQDFASTVIGAFKDGVKGVITGDVEFSDFLMQQVEGFANSVVNTVIDGFFSSFTNSKGTGTLDKMLTSLGTEFFGLGANKESPLANAGYGDTADRVAALTGIDPKELEFYAAEDLRHTEEMFKIDKLIEAVNALQSPEAGPDGPARDAANGANNGLSNLNDTMAPLEEDPLADLSKSVNNGNANVEAATESLKSPMWAQVKETASGFKNLISNNLAGFTMIASGMATAAMGGSKTDKILGYAQMAIGAYSVYSGINAGATPKVKAATGGRISGPGTGTSDSIIAAVSNGEYIINAAAAKANMDILEHINSGGSAVSLPKFAKGGLVGRNGAADRSNFINSKTDKGGRQVVEQKFDIHVTGDISRQTRNEIQRMIPVIATGVNAHNYENGTR